MSSNGAEAAGAAAIFGAFFIVYLLVILAIVAFCIIVKWKLFVKRKQPGWAALIPIYSDYILCKMVGVNPWWILIVYLSSFLGVIPVIGSLLTLAISIYFLVLTNVSLARSFGKEDSFAIGLILLGIVFEPILAFGSAEYKGPTPMKDAVLDKAAEILGKKK